MDSQHAVLEVALALVVLISAGLLIRNFLRLQQVNPELRAPEHAGDVARAARDQVQRACAAGQFLQGGAAGFARCPEFSRPARSRTCP